MIGVIFSVLSVLTAPPSHCMDSCTGYVPPGRHRVDVVTYYIDEDSWERSVSSMSSVYESGGEYIDTSPFGCPAGQHILVDGRVVAGCETRPDNSNVGDVDAIWRYRSTQSSRR